MGVQRCSTWLLLNYCCLFWRTLCVQTPVQTVRKPTATLTLAASGSCNDTLHDELVSSVNSTVVGQAPTEVQDNIMVNKGPCINVS
jgi:hypothetical protein